MMRRILIRLLHDTTMGADATTGKTLNRDDQGRIDILTMVPFVCTSQSRKVIAE